MADTAGEAWVEKSLKRGLCRPRAQHFISELTAAQAPIYKTKLLFWLVIALYTLGKKIMLKTALTQSRKFCLELPLHVGDFSKHIDLVALKPSNLTKVWMQLIR